MGERPDLSTGDFVYQSDQELFLVVIDETENKYRFSVHGWRNIDKKRLDEYLSHDNGKLHSKEQIESFVEEEGDEKEREHYEKMKRVFESYKEISMGEDGPHTEFSLDDPE